MNIEDIKEAKKEIIIYSNIIFQVLFIMYSLIIYITFFVYLGLSYIMNNDLFI
jgi:hypothetical protein